MPPTGREIREHLVRSLHADLIGPFDLDHPDATETLTLPPSRVYLTGFLAPKLARQQDDDPTAEEDHAAGSDVGGEDDGDGDEAGHAALATLDDPDRLRAALVPLVEEYGQWLRSVADEREHPLDGDRRREVRDDLVIPEAEAARERIAAGIEVLATDPVARRAFCLANQAMAMAALQRSPERYPAGGERPSWRLFQLAFVLLSVRGVALPHHDDRSVVDLVFFPTGGAVVVVREMFERAERSVVVAGFSFDDPEILRPLHAAMRDRGVKVRLFVNVASDDIRRIDDVARFVEGWFRRFFAELWPFGEPRPETFYDPRQTVEREFVSLHAKCVVVDDREVQVTSANFTGRGQRQTGNIELGVRIEDPTLATAVVGQWNGLVAGGIVVPAPR